jgi:protein phosphatase
MHPDWGFFGLFDGHGGDKCSTFVADRLRKELSSQGCPKDDAAVKKLLLNVDGAFLETGQEGGSTGTCAIVHKPVKGSNKLCLRVANVGDSRVLLGRRDGSIVDGGGTDQGLTTDHKPSNPSERHRIYRCGGHVEEAAGGVARVNGVLAVSRCFGDADHKRTGGPGPEDRPVTANPEFGRFECEESDLLILVCDGISEGDFSNAEVVKLVATSLKETGDPGAAAQAVCRKALETNSKDNLTCMIVLFSGVDRPRSVEFIPGPMSSPGNPGFTTAYEAMAERAGLNFPQAAEMRYENIVEEMARRDIAFARADALQSEVAKFGTPAGSKGSSERSAWFRTWKEKLSDQVSGEEGASDMPDPDMALMRMLLSRPGGQDLLRSLRGGVGGRASTEAENGRHVRVQVPDTVALRKAVEEHSALEWDSRMTVLVGAEGTVKTDDLSDGTSNVRFPSLDMVAWLPTRILKALDGAAPGPADEASQQYIPPAPARPPGHYPRTVLHGGGPPVEPRSGGSAFGPTGHRAGPTNRRGGGSPPLAAAATLVADVAPGRSGRLDRMGGTGHGPAPRFGQRPS